MSRARAEALSNGRAGPGRRRNGLDQVLVGVGFYYNRGAMMEATLEAIGDLKRATDPRHPPLRDRVARPLHGRARACSAPTSSYELSPWDFAAGRLFVEEAGGRVTTCRGEPLPLARTDILASNGPLHDAVLDIVEQRFPPHQAGVNAASPLSRSRRLDLSARRDREHRGPDEHAARVAGHARQDLDLAAGRERAGPASLSVTESLAGVYVTVKFLIGCRTRSRLFLTFLVVTVSSS